VKRTIVVGSALILMLLLITSCGVPHEEYAKVSSDLAVAQTQIQSLQGDLTKAQTQIQSLQSELSAKKTELSAMESEVGATKSDLEAEQEKLAQGRARIEILNAIFIPAITGELDRMTEAESLNYFLEWRDTVNAVEDPVLTAKFEVMIETLSDEAFLSFLLYLLESTADALE